MNNNPNEDNHEIADGSNLRPRTLTNCPSSPATQGRSLREVEDQIAALRKENFNLKLRIYFLEEKPTSLLAKSSSLSNSCMSVESIENISKLNIDLKVMILRFISFNAPFTMFTFMLHPPFFRRRRTLILNNNNKK